MLAQGHETKERAPIFLQFLDAVWQMMRQCPDQFEFQPTLLVFLADAMYCSGLWGTFLADSVKERFEKQLPSQTRSVWSTILAHATMFARPVNGVTTPVAKPVSRAPSAETAAPVSGSDDTHNATVASSVVPAAETSAADQSSIPLDSLHSHTPSSAVTADMPVPVESKDTGISAADSSAVAPTLRTMVKVHVDHLRLWCDWFQRWNDDRYLLAQWRLQAWLEYARP